MAPNPIESLVFWHEPYDGGPHIASSVVGPAPLDTTAAKNLAIAATQYAEPRGVNRHRMEFTPVPPALDSITGLRQVKAAYDGCARCHLCATRFQVVHWRGNPNAAVVFLGEAPGQEEDAQGIPFIGKAGKFQDACCRENEIDPERDLLWLNALGCRPAKMTKGDRTPLDGELIACSERIFLALQAVRPRVVLCLGKTATKYFFDEAPPVWGWTRFSPPDGSDNWIMVGYAHHPAYLVRVVGAPSMYKEYAAQRTFYRNLRDQIPGLTKVSEWWFPPRYLTSMQEPKVAWHAE